MPNFFLPWAEFAPSGVELLAVCYPGREERLNEPHAERMEQLVEPIAGECARLSDVPLVFFGHSMGASVAYETALRLQEHHGVTMPALFVSGAPAPGWEHLDDLSNAPDAELVAELSSLNGTDSEVFDHPELVALVLPAIRADYRLACGHLRDLAAAPERPALSSPIVAYYGDQDPDTDTESVGAWAAATTSTFAARVYDGDHFYLVDHAATLVRDIVRRSMADH
jgi:pyochelin biosynthetic protein PchC